jgi:hypothetical protein
MSDALCWLHLSRRDAVPLVGDLVGNAAVLLGLDAASRTRLRAVAQEVAEAIVADSFADRSELDMDIAVERRPGGMAVVIDDRGAPSGFSSGQYPPRVADLLRLGFADGFDADCRGRSGNHTEIVKNFAYESVGEDPEFVSSAQQDADIVTDASGKPQLDVRPIEAGDAVEVARLFFRCYGYTAHQSSVIYEPERLAEYIQGGRHLATVAVSPSGRIVGHLATQMERAGARTGRIGLLAVEPGYRRHGITGQLALIHLQGLVKQGVIGQFAEAVTVHVGSQKAAATWGASPVGLILAYQPKTLDFEGFETQHQRRRAVMMLYGSFGQAPQREVFAPPLYQDVIKRIYEGTSLPRKLRTDFERIPEDLVQRTTFNVALKPESNVATVSVAGYGKDFLTALQQQVRQLEVNRFDLILLHLPLHERLTSYFGSGLQEIGLSFAGVFPEYSDGGDVLVLQHPNEVEIEPADIRVVGPLGEYLRDFVIKDYEKALATQQRESRTKATMARLYEALG